MTPLFVVAIGAEGILDRPSRETPLHEAAAPVQSAAMGERGHESASIIVRLATVDDIPPIQAVETEAGERFRSIEDPRIARCADSPPYWTAGLEKACSEQRAWAAVDDDGSVIGFAVAWTVDGEGHLDELAVAPAHGRRGVGTALVDEVVAWTRTQGLTSITLTTFRDVAWNAPYYEKLGFHVVAALSPALQALIAEQATWGLEPSIRVVMRRTLGPTPR